MRACNPVRRIGRVAPPRCRAREHDGQPEVGASGQSGLRPSRLAWRYSRCLRGRSCATGVTGPGRGFHPAMVRVYSRALVRRCAGAGSNGRSPVPAGTRVRRRVSRRWISAMIRSRRSLPTARHAALAPLRCCCPNCCRSAGRRTQGTVRNRTQRWARTSCGSTIGRYKRVIGQCASIVRRPGQGDRGCLRCRCLEPGACAAGEFFPLATPRRWR